MIKNLFEPRISAYRQKLPFRDPENIECKLNPLQDNDDDRFLNVKELERFKCCICY